jgi:hypothetical protein
MLIANEEMGPIKVWAVDKDGYEYLTEDLTNPEIVLCDGRLLSKEKCPTIFKQLRQRDPCAR